jgi:hypothetical protein
VTRRVAAGLAGIVLVVAFTVLVFQQPGTVQGHVYEHECAGIAPLAQFNVCYIPAVGIDLKFADTGSSKTFRVATDSGGFYWIQLPPGRYTVRRTWAGGSAPMDVGPSTAWILPLRSSTVDYDLHR